MKDTKSCIRKKPETAKKKTKNMPCPRLQSCTGPLFSPHASKERYRIGAQLSPVEISKRVRRAWSTSSKFLVSLRNTRGTSWGETSEGGALHVPLQSAREAME